MRENNNSSSFENDKQNTSKVVFGNNNTAYPLDIKLVLYQVLCYRIMSQNYDAIRCRGRLNALLIRLI